MTEFLRLAAASPAYGLRLIMRPLLASSAEAQGEAHATGAGAAPRRRGDVAALDRVEL